jgi:two-component system sensor histidine kinase UhpB
VRHAGAQEAHVSLDVRDGAVRLVVRDDGRGLPVDAKGQVRTDHGRMGLTGMRERILAVHGTVRLRNATPGTEVSVMVPLPAMTRTA